MTMPTETTTELQQLFADVNAFSEQAMRNAIRAATRDPAVAERLAERVRAEIEEDRRTQRDDRFATVAAAVVIAEARGAKAIPFLLEVATADDRGFVGEACAYGLQRIGAPALDAAVVWLEAHSEASDRVREYAYDVLLAASDLGADDAARGRVADFCLARLAAEPEVMHMWGPAMAAAQVLVMMKDERARPLLVARRDQASADPRKNWEWLLKMLDEPLRIEVDCDWRIDWPEQCRVWADFLDPVRDAELRAKFKPIVNALGRLAEEKSHRLLHPPELEEPTWPIERTAARVGRNEPCPCGSGKKYKKCCGG
ncbi:MAG: SEC-C metal-binding domain-containing protein [Planctomycetota bacterium]|nr:SEC-C metal-binding domain-containing protein [Planctomycetota bacterium]